jgi:pyruvate formate lyase activating enzyme
MEDKTRRNYTGRIHSLESVGTLDGPGIRFVIFIQGCVLRCLYCHNPDCQDLFGGREVTVDDLMGEINKYLSYMRFSGGGVTVSGGEPFVQFNFVQEIFRRCKKQGLHTTLDTSGFVNLNAAKSVLNFVDLVLLDIKSFDPQIYENVTKVPIEPTLKFAQYLLDINKPTWVRFVLVPHLTDFSQNVEGLAQFVSKLHNVELVEILPFHKMGEYKWEQLGDDYKLKNTLPPSPEKLQAVMDIFRRYGLEVR